MESFTPKTVTLTKDNINDDIDPENCLESMCLFFSTTDSKKINKNEPLQSYYNSFCLDRNTLCFIKTGTGTKFSLF